MKKIILLTFILSTAAIACFLNFEPSVTSAASAYSTSSVNLIVSSDLSLQGCTGNSNMSNQLGMVYDVAVGTTTPCIINTSNNAGYTLTVKATSSPALAGSSGSFTNIGAVPNDLDTAVPSGYRFGFTCYGTHASTNWGLGTTGSCGKGSLGSGSLGLVNPGAKYTGLETTATTTAYYNGSSVTNDSFTLCFAAAQKGEYAPSGSYQASAVITVTTNP